MHPTRLPKDSPPTAASRTVLRELQNRPSGSDDEDMTPTRPVSRDTTPALTVILSRHGRAGLPITSPENTNRNGPTTPKGANLPKSKLSPSVRMDTMPKKPRLQLVTAPLKSPSPLPLADSPKFAAAWRLSTTFLNACLPPGSQSLYTARKYGNHIGVQCQCPRCDARPPHEVRPWNRWRWMAFHEMTAHKGGR